MTSRGVGQPPLASPTSDGGCFQAARGAGAFECMKVPIFLPFFSRTPSSLEVLHRNETALYLMYGMTNWPWSSVKWHSFRSVRPRPAERPTPSKKDTFENPSPSPPTTRAPNKARENKGTHNLPGQTVLNYIK